MIGVETTQGSGHDEIGHQQQAANGCEPPGMEPSGRINTAAIGKVFADPNVVNPHQPSEGANGEQMRKRSETHGRHGQADDVRFAGTPIPIEERGSADPTDIPGATDGTDFHTLKTAEAIQPYKHPKLTLRPQGESWPYHGPQAGWTSNG